VTEDDIILVLHLPGQRYLHNTAKPKDTS